MLLLLELRGIDKYLFERACTTLTKSIEGLGYFYRLEYKTVLEADLFDFINNRRDGFYIVRDG